MIDCRYVHLVVVEPWPSNFLRLRFVASDDIPAQNPVPQRLSYVSSETGQMRRCVLYIACVALPSPEIGGNSYVPDPRSPTKNLLAIVKLIHWHFQKLIQYACAVSGRRITADMESAFNGRMICAQRGSATDEPGSA